MPAAFDWDEGAWSLARRLRGGPAGRRHVSSSSTMGSSATSCARLRGHRRAGQRWCRRRRAAEDPGAAPDGVVLSNGPGDPAATAAYAAPEIRNAGRRAAYRSSASAWATSSWRWRWARDTEDGPGPPRGQPSGAGPGHRQGGDRFDESRLHRRPGSSLPERSPKPMCRSSTAATPAWRCAEQAGVLRAAPPGGLRPDRSIRSISSGVSPS